MISSPSKIKARSTAGIVAFLALVVIFQFACHKTVPVARVQQASPPPASRPDMVLAPGQLPFKFVAYGDIRFTAAGPLRQREVSNSFARDAIVDAIVQAKPAFVLISGDLVWRGADAADWKHYDKETTPLYDAHIPLLPTIGNHEYLSSRLVGNGRTQGLRNLYQRFPDIPHRLEAPWYSAQYANCYFLLLDSEDDDAPDSQQMKWVRSQLDALPDTIEFLFVVLHRPPHTSATDGIHRQRLQEIELSKMLEARQQKAARPRIIVIAGHVHNYERYEKNGVAYIVSGGGGAHPHPLTRGADDLYRPVNARETEYHYCLFSVDRGKLRFEMYRLSDARPAKFEVRDGFEFPEK
jgi:hypothetical protein